MIHDLKIWPEYFEAVASGQKTVELRREDDRRFAVGDVLVLREWIGRPVCGLAWSPDEGTHDIIGTVGEYTGRTVTVTVTHVLRDVLGHWLQPGVVALSIVRIDDPSEIP